MLYLKHKERERTPMKDFLAKVLSTVFPTNEKGEIKQTVRNDFKRDFIVALRSVFTDLGIETHLVADGIAVVIPNETEGSIIVVVDGAVKSLGFDLNSEAEAFAQKVAEKAQKEKEKAEAKAKKIAEAEALKAKKNAK